MNQLLAILVGAVVIGLIMGACWLGAKIPQRIWHRISAFCLSLWLLACVWGVGSVVLYMVGLS